MWALRVFHIGDLIDFVRTLGICIDFSFLTAYSLLSRDSLYFRAVFSFTNRDLVLWAGYVPLHHHPFPSNVHLFVFLFTAIVKFVLGIILFILQNSMLEVVYAWTTATARKGWWHVGLWDSA